MNIINNIGVFNNLSLILSLILSLGLSFKFILVYGHIWSFLYYENELFSTFKENFINWICRFFLYEVV